ncbi:sodium:solute symporter [Portibacter marinus]|uniref:sodium:solute symporter n=1 Tax=Portibacter marinus TaxID=2898660 RepID=UPI001F1C5947|nr:sodium:solute symporter [Portibacter marinus]
MSLIDWIILGGTLLFIILYGLYKTRKENTSEGYLKGGNDAKWWTIGLSVMATQASAITFLSTPGQAFDKGLGFVQFYFGLPLAMIVLCITFIPIYYRLKVYTAYEFLENRFDLKTRSLAAILFLIQRGLAAGITIYAPAIIFSVLLGWNLKLTCIIIGILVIIYTVSGGTKAVSVTQKQQMIIILSGMVIAFIIILRLLPDDMSFTTAMELAGASGKTKALDFSFDLETRYTFWSGITGGFFLALAYFGTDQSQVQRYLGGRTLRESRLGLLFNGLFKLPLQFFILLVGVMVFVFYQFAEKPLNFNPAAENIIKTSDYSTEYQELETEYNLLQAEKATLSRQFISATNQNDPTSLSTIKTQLLDTEEELSRLRAEGRTLMDDSGLEIESNDRDYVFLSFILKYLPKGLIGLLLAVILSAAMSSTAAEINALGTTTVVDIYKRNVGKDITDQQYLRASKLFTLAWGVIAIIVATTANLFDNLIQLVNYIGSVFYGTILGIFLVAFYMKKIGAKGVFYGAILAQATVITVTFFTDSFLWYNVIGCFAVILYSMMIQRITGSSARISEF